MSLRQAPVLVLLLCLGACAEAGRSVPGRFSTTEAVLALLSADTPAAPSAVGMDPPRPAIDEEDRRVYLSVLEGRARGTRAPQRSILPATEVLTALGQELGADVASGRLVAAERIGSRNVLAERPVVCDLWRIETRVGGSETALCGEVDGTDVVVVRHIAREGTDPSFQRALDFVTRRPQRRRADL